MTSSRPRVARNSVTGLESSPGGRDSSREGSEEAGLLCAGTWLGLLSVDLPSHGVGCVSIPLSQREKLVLEMTVKKIARNSNTRPVQFLALFLLLPLRMRVFLATNPHHQADQREQCWGLNCDKSVVSEVASWETRVPPASGPVPCPETLGWLQRGPALQYCMSRPVEEGLGQGTGLAVKVF